METQFDCDDKKRCGCGCFLSEENVTEEYGEETYYTCNNPKCPSKGLRSR